MLKAEGQTIFMYTEYFEENKTKILTDILA